MYASFCPPTQPSNPVLMLARCHVRPAITVGPTRVARSRRRRKVPSRFPNPFFAHSPRCQGASFPVLIPCDPGMSLS
eukprot:scaffold900_cov399-Pavlova_lutheri.AAC.18